MSVQKFLRLQRAFDESRGIANLPEADTVAGSDRLARLEYSLIGLTGEVGEVANIIKKARRDRAQGKADDFAGLAGLGAEIADVFAYLLKLADQADIDPGRAYLAKMCRNAHRFSRKAGPIPALSVCGPPGSGKSTIVRALEPSFSKAATYIERFEDNPYLERLDQPSADFDGENSQGWFLEAMASFVVESPAVPLLLDQDPTAIVLVYSQFLFDRAIISSATFENHMEILLELEIEEASKLAARTVVLLDAPADTLAERCGQKAGPMLDVEFLENVRQRFSLVFDDLPNVVKIDTDRQIDAIIRDVRACAENLFL